MSIGATVFSVNEDFLLHNRIMRSYVHEMSEQVCNERAGWRVTDVITAVAGRPVGAQILVVLQDTDHCWSQYRAPWSTITTTATSTASVDSVLQTTHLEYVARVR